MPLREHIAELRRRLIVSVLAIALAAVAGWYLYEPLFDQLQQPLEEARRERGITASANFAGVLTALNLHLKGAAYIGVVAASPVWLYQIWRFVTPGLTRRERRTSIAFVAAAVPLFLSGVVSSWLVLPRAVTLLIEFVPDGGTSILGAEEYFGFATRFVLVFGLAFVVPLFFVALNVVGLLSGAQLGGQWRMAVFLTFVFTAIMSPTPDAFTMVIMAVPMIALYVLAVAFCLVNDRRRRRRRADDPVFGLDDDEASPIDGIGAPDRLDDAAPAPDAGSTRSG